MPVSKPINVRKEPKLKKGKVKQSKRVTDRVKATGALMGRIRLLSAKAAAGFEDKLAVELRDGEVMPDQKLALTLVGRSVKTALGLLEKADNAYCGKAVSRRFLSDACIHTASHEIYPELVDVRRAIDRRFGNKAGRRIHGMEGHTLRKPKRQHPQLKSLVKKLKSWRGIPKPLRPGPPGEREHWLAQLEPGYKKLTQMLSELEKHEMQEERLRHDRDFELECFDAVYSEALALVRAVFRLGGRGEKAVWQLLPTVQRRRLKGKARQEGEARAECVLRTGSRPKTGCGRKPGNEFPATQCVLRTGCAGKMMPPAYSSFPSSASLSGGDQKPELSGVAAASSVV